jgi:uncharacterized membrane protein YccF (DUF307 family)
MQKELAVVAHGPKDRTLKNAGAPCVETGVLNIIWFVLAGNELTVSQFSVARFDDVWT